MITTIAMTLAVSQDFDIGRVIVVILFLLGGFVQWLIKWWKEKNAGSASEFNVAEKIEELKARSKAWLKQTGQIKTPEKKPPLLAVPMRFAVSRQPDVKSEVQATSPYQLSPDRTKLNAKPGEMPSSSSRRHPMMEQIAGIGGLRRAIMLNEILGPPKSLQNEPRQIN